MLSLLAGILPFLPIERNFSQCYNIDVMDAQQLLFISLAVAILALILSFWNVWNAWSWNRLRRTVFTGRNGTDLELVLQALSEDLASTRHEQLQIKDSLAKLYEAVGFAVQKVGIVRFNPFSDGGGNFSFCLALLDGHNSGVVITSMHGREQNRIYSKKIINGKTEVTLTEEEQRAIMQANSKP